LALLCCAGSAQGTATDPVAPAEAVQLAAAVAPDHGIQGTFLLTVRASGVDKQRKQVFLNSELDYRDQRNLTLVIEQSAIPGLEVSAFLLWEPQVEGRNVHSSQFHVYFHDPFLAFAYLGSIPFFVALYHAFRVLGSAPDALRRLRLIRYCAIALIGFIVVGEVVLLRQESDDRAGGVFMGGLFSAGAIAMAAVAARAERRLRQP